MAQHLCNLEHLHQNVLLLSCIVVVAVGSLLVTFKSRLSVPPYRIENMSSDVVIFFAQRGVAHQRAKWNWLTPAAGGNKMAYAWDEPNEDHYMTIRVCSSVMTVMTAPTCGETQLSIVCGALSQPAAFIPSATSIIPKDVFSWHTLHNKVLFDFEDDSRQHSAFSFPACSAVVVGITASTCQFVQCSIFLGLSVFCTELISKSVNAGKGEG